MTMKVAVVIPTVNRPEALARAVEALQQQTLMPTHIALSCSEGGFVPPGVASAPRVTVLSAGKGASRQRNVAVRWLPGDTDVVVFLDDDSLPREDFLKCVSDVFLESPEVVAMSGRMAVDGAAEKREIPVEELKLGLERSRLLDPQAKQLASRSLYGCNMAVRYSACIDTPFDEALPLYSWLEDLDLARRLERLGSVVLDERCVVAHQGSASGGRTQHRRFGYSSVANPVYLHHKGSLNTREAVWYVLRPMSGNLAGVLRGPGRRGRVDRLHGQLLAMMDLVRGRCRPERVMEI